MNKKHLLRLGAGVLVFGTALALTYFAELELWYIYLAAYLILGLDIVWRAAKGIAKGQLFDENFLMSIATIGAFALAEFPEAVAVMLFYQLGELFSGYAYDKSIKSVTALLDMRPEYANLVREGGTEKVSPEKVKIGDLILVKTGEKIPLDGVITEGAATLDTAAMTGEFLPKEAAVGDEVISGCINKNGLITIRVTKPFSESAVSKVLTLITEAAEKKAPAEKFITKFSRVYTPIVVGVAVLLAVLPPLAFGGIWADWIHRALVFLVVSCPCALVLSVPLGFFAGLGRASKGGVLVKGGDYLDALAKIDTVVFDKTGTLTEGRFSISEVLPASGETEEKLLELAAHAEYNSNHPVAAAVREAFRGEIAEKDIAEYKEIAGHGISILYKSIPVFAGNEKLMRANGIAFEAAEEGTKIYIAADGKFAGCVVLSDTIKTDSAKTVKDLRAEGVTKIVMLTGDNAMAANGIAAKIGLDEVYAGLLPHEKTENIERLKKDGRLVFVGDGINDAPALKAADIGVAMGGLGSDAAIAAADAVIMTDNPHDFVNAVKTAKRTKKIIAQNIVFILVVKLATLVLGAFGFASMWAAVFADIGTALLAVLNSARILK